MEKKSLQQAMSKEQSSAEKEFCVVITLAVKDEHGNWKTPDPTKMKVVPFVVKWKDLYDNHLLATATRGAILTLNNK